jgi:enamine deaminase RidA (YjgF/YER057c/UK114 family)
MPQTAQVEQHVSPEQVLARLRLVLPPVREEDRMRLRQVGRVLYTPGILPHWGDTLRHVGSVDDDISVRVAVRAAQLCVHNLVALLREELGSLDRVQQVHQVNVLVSCSEGFENPARVADGASEAMFEIFGPRGRHRRDVLATRELPGGAPVQISAILQIAASVH